MNKEKRILITNDDGIISPGIIRLAEAAKAFGEVWVIAPREQRSAASHCISLHAPVDVYPADFPVSGVKAFAVEGSPSDCVRVGSLSIMPEKPDVVLSGINFGYNVASDVQYSATVGAAFEAAFQGYAAIALSEGTNCHEVTDAHLADVLSETISLKALPGQIVNVNFPDCKIEEYRGIRRGTTVSEGMVFRDSYNKVKDLPGGGSSWMVEGKLTLDSEEGTDYRAVLEGCISIGAVNNVGYPVIRREEWE
ncbi:MAG: 5'/3'-nucleotidase SurE [Lachnospiraceae bacterium]|nr:5'/3'-nucleotidase SurE [Lachnospiraceae bacterium]